MKINTKIIQKTLSTVAVLALFSTSNWAHSAEQGLPIVGGQEVLPADQIAKTTVALIIFAGEKAGLCTGSILDSSRILTAAHCVQGFTKGVIIFKLKLPQASDEVKKEEVRTVSNVVFSADFPGNNRAGSVPEYHDLAILSFDGGLPAGYEPVKVITQGQFETLKTGTTVTVAGYGATNSEHTGEGTLKKTKLKIKGAYPAGVSIVVSAVGTNSCNGDSGGPAYVSIGNKLHLWGVLSRGDKYCTQFAIYTKFVKGQDVNGTSAIAALR